MSKATHHHLISQEMHILEDLKTRLKSFKTVVTGYIEGSFTNPNILKKDEQPSKK